MDHQSYVLSTIASDPQHVAWGLDEMDAAGQWKFYASGQAGSDLVEFKPGEGYWVHVSSAAEITVPAPVQQEYHYDSEGRRQASIVIYDGENQIAKYDDLGILLVSYFQGPGIDNPVSMRRAAAGGDETYYYHTDALGSVTELTDAAGDVAQSYRYDAFGSIVQQSGNVQNPFTYTGREFDPETGLYYYRARYYDAEAGRFLARDPVGRFGKRSLYVYVNNNAVNMLDRLGLFPEYDPNCRYCGPGDGIMEWIVAELDFKYSCYLHDKCYATCTESKDSCDDSFCQHMVNVCLSKYDETNGLYPCIDKAGLYCFAVRKYGDDAYKSAQECCE